MLGWFPYGLDRDVEESGRGLTKLPYHYCLSSSNQRLNLVHRTSDIKITYHYLCGCTEENQTNPITWPMYKTGMCRMEARHVTATPTIRDESVNVMNTIHYLALKIIWIFKSVSANVHHKVTPCLTLRRLMSYIYGAPILDVSRSHTTTQHSR